jgi:diketogulonate reductase-like aldo/keto reductase
MKTRSFGPGGHPVSVLGQGTWEINVAGASPQEAAESLRFGIDQGMTHIDTAEMYGSGAAERLVGRAIAGRRDEVFLVSKVLPQNASRAGVVKACESSLARLGTDRLDCYLLHWRGSIPLSETIAGFRRLMEEGKILSYGVSNFDVSDLQEALQQAGPGTLACNQVLYHLQQRSIEYDVLPWCERHDIALVGYSPFGHGDFPDSASPGGQTLSEIAGRYRATARQIALAFLLRHPSVFLIPKASAREHVTENATAERIELSTEDLETLNRFFPAVRARHLPML